MTAKSKKSRAGKSVAKPVPKASTSASARASARTASNSAADRRASWSDQVVRAVWPQERDFFERPERYRYVRKLIKTEGCVFCEAERNGASVESLVLVQDEYTMVVMNKYPYNTGHLLILPREHIGNIWDLSEAVNQRLAFWLKAAGRILTKEMGCQGLNLGMNHGQVAGAGIPEHLHWHIVPRWGGDTNFFPLIAETKVLPESIEQTYARLKPHFQKEVR